MEKQKYKSYSQIDQDLEILKLEQEISYQKIVQSVQDTKESLEPKNLLGAIPKVALNLLENFSGPIKNVALSVLLKRFLK